MKFSAIAICLFSVSVVSAQLRTSPIYYETKVQSSQALKNLSLPFWDDFSTSSESPDTLLWNASYNVYINDALSINTPTYNAATFDGLLANGVAYDIEYEFEGLTDSLSSHYIDLDGLSIGDSVYLSFFWQAGGFSELPDESDTLSLSFFTSDNEWLKVWSQYGGLEVPNDQFIQEIILLDDSKYFHANFRFKFQVVGKQNGPFDTWHLDYVYLNSKRHKHDTTHFDRALTGKPTALFGLYREIPAHVFFKDPQTFLSNQSIQSRNLDSEPQAVEYFYKLENLTSQEVYYDAVIPGAAVSMTAFQVDTIIVDSDITITSQINPLDSQVIKSTFSIFSGDKNLFEEVIGSDTVFLDQDLKVNDTICQTYTLQNHYAYDDGIAEYAGGLDEKDGQLAVRFVLAEPDTLTHIDIHFPSIDPDGIGRSVSMMVWADVERSSVPSSRTTLLSSQAYTIEANTAKNEFKRIKIDRTQLIQDTVYIGFQQLDNDYLAVGFDSTNPDAKGEIFSNTTGTWLQNERLNGIFMIRPVFQFDSTFILSNKKVAIDLTPYPNPSKGLLNFHEPIDEITVYSIDGSLMYKGQSRNVFDVSFLENGVYLLRTISGGYENSSKLILNK